MSFNFLKDKAFGYFITVASILLAFITAFLYLGLWTASEYMSWLTFVFFVCAFTLPAIVMVLAEIFPKVKFLLRFVPAITFVFNLAAILLFVPAIVPFIIDQSIGREGVNFFLGYGLPFFFTLLFFIITIVTSIVALFWPQTKVKTPVALEGKAVRTALSYVARSFSLIFTILLGVLLVGTPIAMDYYEAISAALKQPTTLTEQLRPGEGEVLENYKTEFNSVAELRAAGHALSEEVEQEGAVLLKNDNVNGKPALPLSQGNIVSLFSMTSVDPVYVGTGSGNAKVVDPSSYKDSLENAGLVVNSELWNWYNSSSARTNYARQASGSFPTTHNIRDANWSQINTPAKTQIADAAIFVFGRVGGEAADLKMLTFSDSGGNSKKGYLQVSDKEADVLRNLKQQKDAGTFKKIIVIINSSNQVETEILNDPAYGIDAALWVGGLGQRGIDAVGKLLTGAVNPSGRLSDMFWNKHEYNPVHANFGVYTYNTGALRFDAYPGNYDFYVVYQEGMYLGYRYAETRYEDYVLQQGNPGTFIYSDVVTYPFGHGLSYTDFQYSNFDVRKLDRRYEAGKGESYKVLDKTYYEVSVTVKNTGSVAGKEVVQVYMQRPYGQYDIENGIEKPAVELVGFAKTKLLQPSESVQVKINIDEKYFAAFDANTAKTYVLTPGRYYLTVGKNSHDAINNILALKGKNPSNTNGRMDAYGNADLAEMVLNQTGVDDQKYKYSDATGNEITNLFDFVDINRYEGRGSNSVTYISRNDWTGTVKFVNPDSGTNQTSRVVLTKTQAMIDAMANNVPQDPGREYPKYNTYSDGSTYTPPSNNIYPDEHWEKVITLAEMGVQLPDGTPLIPYDDPRWDTFMDQLSWNDMVNLLRNGLRCTEAVVSVSKPKTLDHNGPMGFCNPYTINSNGLAVKRNDPDKDKYPTCYPSNGIVAATFNVELTERVGKMIGEDGLWSGHSGLYGTGINIHRTPYAGRAFEYYSEDPILTGKIVAGFSKGIQSKGVYVYNKHFVLNEQEFGRFGISTWCNEQTMREIYLRAFEIPIVEGGAKCIMGGLNRIGAVWASASKELNTDWLRGEAGLTGFVVTDWWDNYSDAYYMQPGPTLLAGTDIPDGTLRFEQINRFRKDSPDGEYGNVAWAMRESAKRIMFTVAHSNALNGFTVHTRIIPVTPLWKSALDVANIIAPIGFSVSVLGLLVLILWDPFKKLFFKVS